MNLAQQINSLFVVSFGREATEQDRDHHLDLINSGMIDIHGIADALAASQEFANKHYEDVPIAVVSQVYKFGLDRDASVDEIPGWANLLSDGVIDTGDFLEGVAFSEERSVLIGIDCDQII